MKELKVAVHTQPSWMNSFVLLWGKFSKFYQMPVIFILSEHVVNVIFLFSISALGTLFISLRLWYKFLLSVSDFQFWLAFSPFFIYRFTNIPVNTVMVFNLSRPHPPSLGFAPVKLIYWFAWKCDVHLKEFAIDALEIRLTWECYMKWNEKSYVLQNK